MNTKVLKFLLLSFLIFSPNIRVLAQLTLVNEPDKPSVQASEMTKYGKFTPQLYTGRFSLNIPIYVYRDSRFTIPITLDYSYNGLVANRQAGIVGLGWSLGCGGSITREVRGIPDELHGMFKDIASNNYDLRDIHGFDYIPFGSHLDMPIYEVINRPSSSNVLKTAYDISNTYYESSPDIYHFSFPGHSGSFYRNPDGTFTVFHTSTFDGDYKIEKANVTLNDENHNVNTQFVITTSDGYRYIFGDIQQDESAIFNYIERNVPKGYDKGSPEGPPQPYRAISFLLRKIESPGGESATFCYNENCGPSDIINYSSTLWIQSESGDDPITQLHYSEDLNTASYLSSIEFSGGKSLNFFYKSKPYGKEGSYLIGTERHPLQGNLTYYLLDSIDTPAGGTKLEYTYNSLGNPYPFLTEIYQEEIGSYVFDYEGLEDSYFPPFGTTTTDHWGYIRRKDSSLVNRNSIYLDNLSTLASSTFDETPNENRNAYTVASSIGLMTRITYPTGGGSILDYQDNTVWRNLRKTSANQYAPFMHTSGSGFMDKGPGSRISGIINTDENGIPTDTTRFLYSRLEEDFATSGSLLVYPRYCLYYAGVMQNGDIVNINLASSSGIANYEATPVEYSRVEEIHPDKSRTVHFYTGWDDYPDDFSSEAYSISRFHSGLNGDCTSALSITGTTTLISSAASAVHNILRPSTSHQSRRGREKKTETYSSDGQLLSRTETDYTVLEEQDAFYEFIYIGEAFCPLMRYTYDTKKQRDRVTDFLQDSSSLSSQIQYTYNSLGQKASEVKTLSNGDVITTLYKYVPDIAQNKRTQVQKAMMRHNRIDSPVRVTVKVRTHGSSQDRILSCDSLTFKAIPVPSSTDTLYLPETWSKRDIETGGWYTYATYLYDSKGNMVQRTDANNMSTAFIWNTDNSGVAMRIDNANAAQANSVLGNSFTFNSSTTSAQMQGAAQSLRSALPNSAVSWYRWFSYGLPIEVCDPSGRITRYTYDAAQRLNIIKDDDAYPVERYYYQTLTR
ncbi:MAG: RHS repeat protein [Bacteroidales bacterium]|nr:RHS repeat protein [Bacteroidales bacterium]